MAPEKNTDGSSDARRCSAADGSQLPMTPDRSADGPRQSKMRLMFIEVEGDARSVASAMRHATNFLLGEENTDA